MAMLLFCAVLFFWYVAPTLAGPPAAATPCPALSLPHSHAASYPPVGVRLPPMLQTRIMPPAFLGTAASTSARKSGLASVP